MSTRTIVLAVPVILILTGAFLTRGQQPQRSNEEIPLRQTLDSQTTQIADLSKQIEELKNERSGTGRYQIAVTSGFAFTQVFRVDTETGNVCQAIGKNPMRGELMGTSLPHCAQQ
jgi:hypothetical protein